MDNVNKSSKGQDVAAFFAPFVFVSRGNTSKSAGVVKAAGFSLASVLFYGAILGGLTYTLLRPNYLKQLSMTPLANTMSKNADLLKKVAMGTFTAGCVVTVAYALRTAIQTIRIARENEPVEDSKFPLLASVEGNRPVRRLTGLEMAELNKLKPNQFHYLNKMHPMNNSGSYQVFTVDGKPNREYIAVPFYHETRNALVGNDFYEVETPFPPRNPPTLIDGNCEDVTHPQHLTALNIGHKAYIVPNTYYRIFGTNQYLPVIRHENIVGDFVKTPGQVDGFSKIVPSGDSDDDDDF